MKPFLKLVTSFFFPLVMLTVSTELLVRAIPNDYKLKRRFLDQHADSLEGLILGNSHALLGLNPAHFKRRCFNAANVSQSLAYDKRIYDQYRDNLQNLKFIIMQVSYFSLFYELEDSPEAWRKKNYSLYLTGARRATDYFDSEVLSTEVRMNVKRLISFYVKGLKPESCSPLGWRTKPNADNLGVTAALAANRHRSAIRPVHLLENVRRIEEMLRETERKGILVAIVFLPAHESYRARLDSDLIDAVRRLLAAITCKNRSTVLLDFFENPDFMDTDFSDADHLSAVGSAKMSSLLDEKITDLLKRK